MAELTRQDLVRRFVQELGLQSVQATPVILNEKVQPVYDYRPKYSNFSTFVLDAATNGAVTLYTVPEGFTLYVTQAEMSWLVDGAHDCDSIFIRSPLGEFSNNMTWLYRRLKTGTTDQGIASVSFPFPLEIRAGSTIQLYGAFTAGTVEKYGSVTGILINVP